MTAPSGWVLLSPDNYKEMFEQLGNRLPMSLQDGLLNRRIEVGFVKLIEESNFSANINVVVMQTEVPELDEKQLEEEAQVLTTEFKRVLDSYKLEKSELVTVDELTWAQFSSGGTLKLKVADAKGSVRESILGWPTYTEETPAQWVSFDLKLTHMSREISVHTSSRAHQMRIRTGSISVHLMRPLILSASWSGQPASDQS